MAIYFVDSTTGNDADSGLTMDLALATLDYAIDTKANAAGDIVFVRRIHAETFTGAVALLSPGLASSPIIIMGWPRAADATANGASWTNGSTTVDLVTTLSMDREQHLGRFVTAPDGERYLVTLITDSNTFTIDREYVGATVTLTDGAFTVEADEDYVADMGAEYGFDDSAWTIKEAAWDADADDLPQLDQDTNDSYFSSAQDLYYIFKYLDFDVGSQGTCLATNLGTFVWEGCLFVGSASIIRGSLGAFVLKRCILVNGTWPLWVYTSKLYMRDCAVYSSTDSPFVTQNTTIFLDNVNIGIEGGIGDDVVYNLGAFSDIRGVDVNINMGAHNFWDAQGYSVDTFCSFENYGKVLGAHKTINLQGEITKLDVVAGGGDPYKRTGGADSVIEILYNEPTNTRTRFGNPDKDFLIHPIFEHEFEATTDSRSYRYYVQCEGIVPASDLWIEVEYVSAHDDTSEYTIKRVLSDEAFTARADAEDWAEYLEVTGITPAVASKVRIRCFCRYYDAANKIYIDPLPEIT